MDRGGDEAQIRRKRAVKRAENILQRTCGKSLGKCAADFYVSIFEH